MTYIVLAILALEILRLVISLVDSQRIGKLNEKIRVANWVHWEEEKALRKSELKGLEEIVKGSKELEEIVRELKELKNGK